MESGTKRCNVIWDGISLTLTGKYGQHLCKIKIEPSSRSIVNRAIKAFPAHDCDCFLTAIGLSDSEAFNKNTWTK